MSTKMSWDWVGNYPIFIYTTFIEHGLFNVKIVLGEKGNQNANGYGPNAKAWIELKIKGIRSKDEVAKKATEIARHKLLSKGLI